MTDEPSSKPDIEHGIYRVTHFLVRGTVRFTVESDMIFKPDGSAEVVLEWGSDAHGMQYPAVTAPLDAARLQEITPPGYFLYNGDIEDPRPAH